METNLSFIPLSRGFNQYIIQIWHDKSKKIMLHILNVLFESANPEVGNQHQKALLEH